MRSVALLSLLALPFAAQANLIVNGDFEATTPSGSYASYFGSSQGLTGWTVAGEVALLADGYLGQSSQQLDLSGAYDAPGSSISQTFATVAGGRYTLSFDAYTGGTSYAGSFDVRVDGNTVFSDVIGDEAGNGTRTYTTTFTASGSSATLEFFDGEPYVSHVDNVSVEAVPEPASLAALGVGAGALLRRRRRA